MSIAASWAKKKIIHLNEISSKSNIDFREWAMVHRRIDATTGIESQVWRTHNGICLLLPRSEESAPRGRVILSIVFECECGLTPFWKSIVVKRVDQLFEDGQESFLEASPQRKNNPYGFQNQTTYFASVFCLRCFQTTFYSYDWDLKLLLTKRLPISIGVFSSDYGWVTSQKPSATHFSFCTMSRYRFDVREYRITNEESFSDETEIPHSRVLAVSVEGDVWYASNQPHPSALFCWSRNGNTRSFDIRRSLFKTILADCLSVSFAPLTLQLFTFFIASDPETQKETVWCERTRLKLDETARNDPSPENEIHPRDSLAHKVECERFHIGDANYLHQLYILPDLYYTLRIAFPSLREKLFDRASTARVHAVVIDGGLGELRTFKQDGNWLSVWALPFQDSKQSLRNLCLRELAIAGKTNSSPIDSLVESFGLTDLARDYATSLITPQECRSIINCCYS